MYSKKKDNCTVFSSSLFNDLKPYDIVSQNGSLYIDYGGAGSYSINIDVAFVTNLISSNIPTDPIDGAWYPAFIYPGGSSQYKKTVLERVNYQEPLLGRANFINFVGKFNNWKTCNLSGSDVDRDMVCDWFITSRYNNFIPIQGIMFWFRKIDSFQDAMWFYEMPAGTIFYDNGVLKKKLDYRRVRNLAVDRSVFNSSFVLTTPGFLFNDNKEIEVFDEDKTKVQYSLYNQGFDVGGDYYEIFIPEGEAFSFYDNAVDRARTQAKGIFSYSYVSPALHNIYRELHNALYPYNRGYVMSLGKTRAFQMLCNLLSTGPQIDRVIVRSLSKFSVKNRVLSLLNNSGAADESIQNTAMTNCITDIVNLTYWNLNNPEPQIKFQNVISNNLELYNKIITKYAPELTFYQDTRLKYVNSDGTDRTTDTDGVDGSHMSYGNICHTYYNPNSAGDIIYNNYAISHGQLSYTTNCTSTTSSVDISHSALGAPKTLYLADVSLDGISGPDFYLGPGHHHTGDLLTMMNSYGAGRVNYGTFYDETNLLSVGINNADPSYSWKVSKGPYGLRFHNIDSSTIFGTPLRVRTYNNSNEAEPTFAIYQNGVYELECARTFSGYTQIDRVVYTTDDSYLEADVSASLPGGFSFKKINTGLSRSIAFDKAGIVWLIDTNHYINVGDYSINDDGHSQCLRAKDIKLFLCTDDGKSFKADEVDSYLHFDFKPGNTTIGLFALTLSSLKDACHPNCLSSYEEKVFRKRPMWLTDPQGLDILFTRGYNVTRGSVTSYEVGENGSRYFPIDEDACSACKQQAIQDCLDNCGGVDNPCSDCTEENVSSCNDVCIPKLRNVTDFDSCFTNGPAANIYTYGQYNNEILNDSIGGRIIPDHPSESLGIKRRNDVFNPTGIFCYRENIPITGNNILLEKGMFHPNKGFLGTNHPDYISDRSYALEDRTEKFDSHIFRGRGFYDLRPSFDEVNTHRSSIYIPDVPYSPDIRRQHGLYGFKDGNSYTRKITSSYLMGWSTSTYLDEDWDTGELLESYDFFESGSLNRSIKHVEVNINFLNYMNPQNLRFTLELDDGYSTTYDIIENTNSNSEITSYLDSLDSLHPAGKICLINQEHIKNYTPNYVLRFSDFYNKNTVGSNRPGYNSSPSHHCSYSNLIDHANEEYMQPTLFADGYGNNDKDVILVNAIKHNNFIKSNYTLDKFQGRNIGGVNFKLKVEVINPFDYRPNIMDNLLSNDILSSLKGTNKRTTSNTINNSNCNWELILYATDQPEYHPKDVLGKLSYNNNTYISNGQGNGPHNFIFSTNQAVIPLINKNAPYQYIAGKTECSYYDALNDLLGDTLAELTVFPTLLGYLLTILAFGMPLSMVGASLGMHAITMAYANGGVNDPIINYFINLRIAGRIEGLNEQFYRPVYKNFTFGKPDRAIVGLSNNKSTWYVTEVPIFRYNNSPVAKKPEPKLQYVKLHKNSIFAGLSRFRYELLSTYHQLDLNCNYILNKNIDTLNGEISVTRTKPDANHTSQTIQLKEGDIVRLDNQTTSSDNGYWLVKSSSWTKLPSISETVFLQNNIVQGDLLTAMQDYTAIIIDGYRAYHFFEDGQSVTIANNNTATISNRCLIASNSGYKTVLILDGSVNNDDTKFGEVGLSASECNTILVFNPKFSTSANKANNINWMQDIDHIYKWPLQEYNYLVPPRSNQDAISTTAETSIGYGTDIVNYNILDRESLINKPWNLYDVANNHENNQYKYFNFSLEWDGSDGSTSNYFTFNNSDSQGDKLKAYRYSGKDLGFVSINNGFSQQFDRLQRSDYNFLKTIIDDHYNPLHTAYRQLSDAGFLEIKTDKFKNVNFADSGNIIIDKHLNFNNKIVYFTTGDYTQMVDRYNAITDEEGVSYSTNADALAGSNLGSLRSFYKTMDPIEPNSCYDKDTFDHANCPKTAIRQRILSLAKEAEELSYAIGIATTGDNIYAHVQGSLREDNYGQKIVEYKDTEYYWIHVDPENESFIANEMSVKIPTVTELQVYTISRNIVGTQIITDSQITPVEWRTDYAVPKGDNGLIKLQDNFGGQYFIRYTDRKQQELKNQWLQVDPNLDFSNMVEYQIGSTQHDQVDIQKMMMCYGDNFNDTLFAWHDTYERPANIGSDYIYYKLKEVIDFNQPVYMKFRTMPPRKLKSHDQYFTKYYPTYDGTLARSVYPPSTDYDLANHFYCWRCVDNSGEYVDTPDFYKMMNEMIFRGFYGSDDGSELSNSPFGKSVEPWEWIPYEFYQQDDGLLPPGSYTFKFYSGPAWGHTCDRAVYNLYINNGDYGIVNLNNRSSGGYVEQIVGPLPLGGGADECRKISISIELKCLCDKRPQHPACYQGNLSCHSNAMNLQVTDNAGNMIYDGTIADFLTIT